MAILLVSTYTRTHKYKTKQMNAIKYVVCQYVYQADLQIHQEVIW